MLLILSPVEIAHMNITRCALQSFADISLQFSADNPTGRECARRMENFVFDNFGSNKLEL